MFLFRSPALIGCFVVDRKYFKEIGLLDEGLEIYGGENVELGVRVSDDLSLSLSLPTAANEDNGLSPDRLTTIMISTAFGRTQRNDLSNRFLLHVRLWLGRLGRAGTPL